MEDDKIKSLFSTFEPELSSDFRFMRNLEEKLDSVEIVKQHNAEARTRSKKAMTFAALAGFVVGLLFSLILPYISRVVSDWQKTLPNESDLNILADNVSVIAWILILGTAVFVALNTYELSLSLLKRKERKQ